MSFNLNQKCPSKDTSSQNLLRGLVGSKPDFRKKTVPVVHGLKNWISWPKTSIPTVKFGDLKGAGVRAKVRENINEKYILSIKIISDCFSFLRHPLFLRIVIKTKSFLVSMLKSSILVPDSNPAWKIIPKTLLREQF